MGDFQRESRRCKKNCSGTEVKVARSFNNNFTNKSWVIERRCAANDCVGLAGNQVLTSLKIDVICSLFIYSCEMRTVYAKAVKNRSLELGLVFRCAHTKPSFTITTTSCDCDQK